MTFARLAPLPALALLGACASSGDYPSLAQRPAERAEGTLATGPVEAVPAPPQEPSPELAERLAALRRNASALHAQFTAAVPAAERLARAGGGIGSDSWSSAQVALADLDSLRSRAAVPLADLDALLVDTTIEGGPREAVAAARAAVEGMIAQEDAVLARLRGRLGA